MASNTQKLGKALITGASSGIGAVYADRLAKRGYDLILVARDDGRMRELAQKLATNGSKIEVIKADLTQKADIKKIEETLRTDKGITMLVNNAGRAIAKPFLDCKPDDLEDMITLNVTALTRLSSAAAQVFAERKTGTIVNISSVAALSPNLVDGVYASTKAFVLSLSQALHADLAPKGVRIQAVLPGATRTEIWERSGVDVNHFPKEILMSADDMVDASLKGLDQNELVTIPALPSTKDWETFESAREALGPNLSHAQPASRYTS